MSRKGTPSACKSKQIPRIFRNRRVLCSGRGWSHGEVGVAACSPIGYTGSSCLSVIAPDGDKSEEARKKGKHEARRDDEEASARTATTVWARCVEGATNGDAAANSEPCDDVIGKSADVETVVDIEKWLKTRTESVSSMDLDAIKSEVEEGVDRYLGEELQHAFLEKDPDGLSIDIDLSDKKLSLGYDPLLQELQTEKLLDPCEKDGFILPEFQLDHLDPLALSPDDMMVAGEILPSTSAQPALSVPNRDDGICVDPEQASLMRKELIENHEPHCESAPVAVDELEVLANDKEVDAQQQDDCHSPEAAANLYMQDLSPENVIEELPDVKLTDGNSENIIIEQLKTKAKVKLEPRIIKKRRKVSGIVEKNLDNEIKISDDVADAEDGVMAVVAISTDKISNMTQIVINTGTGEQIYQGKTSELIEATGNFPKLPKIETSTAWNGAMEQSAESLLNNHEVVISNALEELGITDDNLQPISINEHGKVWVCPREDCSRQFSKLYALKGHLLAHYGVRPFKCDFEGCAWAFYSEFKLKRHKETHLKRKDYVCEVEGCNRRFTTIYNLWSHAKLHSRPNRILCQVPDCQEKFQTKRALELHMKSHDQSHAPYVCKHEGCGKRYYSSNALTSHQRCHSYKEIDVKCSWPGCGKIFDKPCRLKAHIRSHTGCKPYLCTFQGCQWAFSSSSKLKRHQKKHTNERKFVCDIPSCGKAFMRSEHLKEHRLTHKDGRYFQCFICNANFSAKSSLYVHIKKHQLKGNVEASTRNAINGQKRGKVRETQCSRVNPVVKSKRKSGELNANTISPNSPKIEDSELNDANLANNNEDRVKCEVSTQDQPKTLYHCPVETCTRSYTTKATLRAHMLKVHGTPVEDGDKSSIRVSEASICNMDYILYTTPSVSEPTEQMIMVAPCDAVILSTTPETDRSPPEPEPPPLNVLKGSEPSSHNTIQRQLTDQQLRKDQGSARTDLTLSDVRKLKANGAALDSVVGASDVLGANDLQEGLLLTEELPSMYYQDDVVGTEYQVLLLDSVPPESTINLRGLE